MTKFHSFLAMAVMVLLTGFSARADWSATVEWETPGSVEIYAGGLGASNKVVVPATATKMDVQVNGSTAIYVTPVDGYVITGGRCLDDDAALKPVNFYSISKRGVSIQSYDHNGHTVKVDCQPLVMDAEIEVNVVNGRENLMCQFQETNRAITLHTGVQKVAFSKEYESTIEFSANASFAVDPYIIYNGDKQTWNGTFGLLSNTYSVRDGDTFEIKYCETEDQPEAPDVNITIDYANDMAKDALSMIYNVTQSKTVNATTGFVAKQGDTVRFVFNTKEYDVVVNGQAVTPGDGQNTSYNLTFNSDETVTISASVRQWGETTVIVGVKSLEGLQMRRGTIDGEIVDPASMKEIGTESFKFKCIDPVVTVEVTKYEITVSEKDPKVFVSAVGDCWIEVAETIIDNEHVPTGVAMPGAPLYVLNSKIVNDTRLVVFVGTDGIQAKGSDLALRDHNRNLFELKEGYNEFMIDKAYNSPFTVVYHGNGSPTVSAYYEGSLCSVDDNEASFFNVDSDGVAHIFAGKNAAACSISAEFGEGVDDSTEIVVDRIHKLTKDNTSVKTFRTCEVSVTPGNNNYLLDGEAAEYEGETHTFKARQNHVISISKGDGPQVPDKVEYTAQVATAPNGTMYAEFTIVETLRVDIEEGATAEIYDAEGENVQTVIYSAEDGNMLGWNGLLTIDFIKPRLKGKYTLVMPADQFVIFDTVSSQEVAHEDFVVTFTVEEDTPYVPDEIKYSFEVGTAANGVMYAEFSLAEIYRVDLKEETTAYIYNADGELDHTVIYNPDENNMLGWNGMLVVDFTKPSKKGDYRLVVPADEFLIIDTLYGDEVPHPDFEATFTVDEDDPYVPVEFQYSYEIGIYPDGLMYAEFITVDSLHFEIEEDAEAYVLDAEGELVQTLIYSEELQNMLAWNGSLIVDFIKPAKKGSYSLVVPADQFKVFDNLALDYVPTEDLVAKFEVTEDTPVQPVKVEYTVEVSTSPNGLMYAWFTIVETLRVDLHDGATAYVLNEEGETVETIVYSQLEQNMFGWNGMLLVDFEKPAENGNYQLVMPADQFVIFDTVSSTEIPHEDFVATFTVDATTGINAVLNGAESVTVVTLDGRVVLREANAEQINTLSNGIYIINGVKYLKR